MSNHDDRTAALIAANRFGLGPRRGELEDIAQDPRGWLKAQLTETAPTPPLDKLPTTPAMFEQEEAWRLAIANIKDPQAKRDTRQEHNRERNQQRITQLSRRMQQAIQSQQPFRERLVRFWSNHFTVALAGGGPKVVLRAISPLYEHEAIRPNLSGDFATLLLAAERHPAMLIYLDNENSYGPNSKQGKQNGRGLNENLAREILELHALSVAAPYTQKDVIGLAKILTGSTVVRRTRKLANNLTRESGHFLYIHGRHEPGAHVLLGKSYTSNGQKQSEAALRDLAHHPATARHIATKLATHFIADTPPPDAIAQLEQTFIDSKGHLPTVHAALIELEPAWQPEQKKLKTPEELVMSTARALGMKAFKAKPAQVFRQLAARLRFFNHAPFTANSPEGWPDSADHWGSPDALLKRIEWANTIAEQSPATLDPMKLYASVMPENPALEQAITRAESRAQGLALLLASPDFQWR